ncbi:MAG: insulinase family protein [Desulfobulbaceae bacterium]|nr:insulinase family protein [Desulfobulbaceae bacterium]
MLDLTKNIPIITHRLSNQLDLTIVSIRKVPIISINLTYFVGSYNEYKGIRGFAHLFEHLMFEGTKNLPKGEFDKICTLAGGSNNAYTTHNKTTYLMVLPSNQLELALWLDSDRMYNSEITEHALTNQKNVVIEEISQNVENRTYGTFRKYLAELAYKADTPYSWDVYGDIDDINNSTLELARKFFDTYYKPSNASLVICGDCEPHSTIELVEKYFGEKSESALPHTNGNNVNVQKGKHFVSPDEVPLDAVFIAFHLPDYMNSDNDTADFISQILAGGRSSLLHDSLVRGKQVASSAGVFTDRRQFSSLLVFYAIASDTSVTADILANELKIEIELLSKRKDLDYLVEKTKNRLMTAIANEIQYTQGLADTIGNFRTFYGDAKRFYDVIEMMTTCSQQSIFEFCDKYLDFDLSIRIDYQSKK